MKILFLVPPILGCLLVTGCEPPRAPVARPSEEEVKAAMAKRILEALEKDTSPLPPPRPLVLELTPDLRRLAAAPPLTQEQREQQLTYISKARETLGAVQAPPWEVLIDLISAEMLLGGEEWRTTLETTKKRFDGLANPDAPSVDWWKVKLALAFYEAGRLDETKAVLEWFDSLYLQEQVMREIARFQARTGNTELALENIEANIRTLSNVSLLLELAGQRYKAGDFDGAQEYASYYRISEEKTFQLWTLQYLANAGRADEVEALAGTLRLGPMDYQTRLLIATARSSAADPAPLQALIAEAENFAEKTRNAGTWQGLALVYARQGDLAKAEAALRKTGVHPAGADKTSDGIGTIVAIERIIEWEIRQGNWEGAAAFVGRMQMGYDRLAELQLEAGRYAEAAAAARKLKGGASASECGNMLGRIAARQAAAGQKAEAARLLESIPDEADRCRAYARAAREWLRVGRE